MAEEAVVAMALVEWDISTRAVVGEAALLPAFRTASKSDRWSLVESVKAVAAVSFDTSGVVVVVAVLFVVAASMDVRSMEVLSSDRPVGAY
jgi:hypothetical protein